MGASVTAARQQMKGLDEPDPSVRLATLKGLPDSQHLEHGIEPALVGRLQELLFDESQAIRLEALRRLTEFAEEQWISYRSIVTAAIRGAGLPDREAFVRQQIAALGGPEDPSTFGAFRALQLLKDGIPAELRGAMVEALTHIVTTRRAPPDNRGIYAVWTLGALATVIPSGMLAQVRDALEGWAQGPDEDAASNGWLALVELLAVLPEESRRDLGAKFTQEVLAAPATRWTPLVHDLQKWGHLVSSFFRDAMVEKLRALVLDPKAFITYRCQAADSLSGLPWARRPEDIVEDLRASLALLRSREGVLTLVPFVRGLRRVAPEERSQWVAGVGAAVVGQDHGRRDWLLLCAWVPLRDYLSEDQCGELVDALLRQHHRGVGSAYAAPSLARLGKKIPPAKRPAVVSLLVATVMNDKDPVRVASAMGALCELGRMIPLAQREQLMNHLCGSGVATPMPVSARIASMLGILGRSAAPDRVAGAVARLLALSGDEADFVQQRAISSLGNLASVIPDSLRPTVVTSLEASAQSLRPLTRERAENSLRKFRAAPPPAP